MIAVAVRPRVLRLPATVAGAVLGVALGLLASALPAGARDALLLAPFLPAAVIDLRTRRIPNALSAGALALALTEAAAPASASTPRPEAALLAGVALMLAARGGFGAGDAKLMAAAGAVAGWPRLLAFLFAMSLAGGLAAGALLLVRRRRGTTMPYGPAIAAGLALILVIAT